jgi:hypothetical protein
LKIFSRAIQLFWLITLLASFSFISSIAPSGFSPAVMVFAYDGQNQVRIVYDGGFLAAFGYDHAAMPLAGEATPTEGASGLFGSFAEFLATDTGGIWNSIKATQPVYDGTVIPRSFELSTQSSDVWVHGNATEHLAEYATSMLNRGVGQDLVNIAVTGHFKASQSGSNQNQPL